MRGGFAPGQWLIEALGSCEGLFRRGRSLKHMENGPTVLCFGQSHTLSLRRAWKRGLYRSHEAPLQFKFLLSDNKTFPGESMVSRSPTTGADVLFAPLAQALNEHIVSADSTEVWLLSVVRGNAHNVCGLFEPDPLFDFIHPDLPALPVRADAQLLPYEAVKMTFRRAAQATLRFYKCLPRENVAGVLHMESPPPIPSQEQCRRAVDQRMMKKALRLPKSVQLSSPEFRMKLWKCQSDVNREVCRESDVTYVSPPEGAVDQNGYLVRDAWHGATHANAWYGALALSKIEAVIRGSRDAYERVSAGRSVGTEEL